MEVYEIAFKTIAVVLAVAGYFLGAIVSDEEFQEWCIYRERNPLVGDIVKFLALGSTWSLVGCGVAAFHLPKLAVGLAWFSLVLHLLTGLVDAIARKRWPGLCFICGVNLAVRASLAALLTWTFIRAGAA